MQRGSIRANVGGVATDIPFGALNTGHLLGFDGTQIVTSARVVLSMTSDFVVPATTLTDITGLTALIQPGVYYYSFTLGVNQGVATSINGYAVNLSSAPTRISTLATIPDSATTAAFRATNNNGTTLLGNAAQGIGVTVPVTIQGVITVPAAATFAVRAQRASATTTILAGSGGYLIQQ
jgi:hypothetical protein